MSTVRLELADPDTFDSSKAYIEQHLAPVATELHRLVNEVFAPGSTSAEADAVDMIPSELRYSTFETVNQHLHSAPKSVIFDGAHYFTLSRELLRAKQVKVMFSATVYSLNGSSAEFRLIRADGEVIANSEMRTDSKEPTELHLMLPLADKPGCIVPIMQVYHIQGKGSWPVCRRFSLSFIYI